MWGKKERETRVTNGNGNGNGLLREVIILSLELSMVCYAM